MARTDEKVRTLIEMFEKQDILYNVCSRDYHNKNKRKEVLMKIGQEVQMTGIRCIMFLLVGLCLKMMPIVTFSFRQCF